MLSKKLLVIPAIIAGIIMVNFYFSYKNIKANNIELKKELEEKIYRISALEGNVKVLEMNLNTQNEKINAYKSSLEDVNKKIKEYENTTVILHNKLKNMTVENCKEVNERISKIKYKDL